MVPLLSWSSTVRRLRAQRPIFTYWTFLIAAGGTCAGIILRGGHPFKVYWATAAAICTSKPDDYHRNPAQLYLSSWSAWSSNNCTCQCGSLEPMLLLRTGTQMVPSIQKELPNVLLPTINARKFFGPLTGYVSPVVFIQWIYACWSGKSTPSEARDWICVKICKRRSSFQQIRSMLAVSIALCVYTFACASFIICPFLFMFNIIFNEMNMVYLPPDEPLTAVGQWSQCVITILLVLAAIINKYHSIWSYNVNKAWKFLMKTLFIHRKELSSHRSDLEWSGSRKALPLQLTVERLAHPEALTSCEPVLRRKTIFQRFTDPLCTACVHVRQEWRGFYLWIRKPIEVSRSNTALCQIMAARVESHGRFQEQRGSVSLVHLVNLGSKSTNLSSRPRLRSF